MKVLLINGSPRANGNTARALKEVADTLAAEGIETETVWIGKKAVRGCTITSTIIPPSRCGTSPIRTIPGSSPRTRM